MNFLSKNKVLVNIIFVLSIVLDFIIAFFINILSQDAFEFFSKKNIVFLAILACLIILYIICQCVIRAGTAKVQKKRLQKAFFDNGGYDTVVEEIKICIENRDYRNIKELKKIVNYIEK